MSGPSPHLSWAELSCKDGTPYPERWRGSRAKALAEVFELLRAAVGVPLLVVSGYRTPAHNKAVGGAPLSQHVEGRALDLAPARGGRAALGRLQEAALDAAREGVQIGGVGFYGGGSVHVDVRPRPAGGRVARWGMEHRRRKV